MILLALLPCLPLAGFLPPDPPAVSPGRSGEAFPLDVRVGLHASAHDLSPLVGLGMSGERFGASVDAWIRPGYWKTLEQQTATHWVQYRVLRYGFVLGGHGLIGSRSLGLLPMAGVEFATGDIAGSSKRPEGEAVPWAGLAVAFAGRQRVGVRVAGKEGAMGWVRGDWTMVF